MMKSLQCLLVVVAVLAAVALGDDPLCTKKSLCSCDTDKGAIDLTPLSSRVLMTKDAEGKGVFRYSPCSDNNTSPCMDAMVCMSTVMGVDESIGRSPGENFISKDGNIAIQYPGDNNKTSIVILKCDQNKDAELTIVDDSDDESYVFQLASQYACIGGPASPGSSTSTKKPTTTSASKTTRTAQKTTKTSPKSTKKTTPSSTKTTSPVSPKSTTSPKSPTTSPKNKNTTSKNTKTTKSTKTTKTTPKGGKSTQSTPKHKTTTPGAAVSHKSISLVALSIIVLAFRQMF